MFCEFHLLVVLLVLGVGLAFPSQAWQSTANKKDTSPKNEDNKKAEDKQVESLKKTKNKSQDNDMERFGYALYQVGRR